MFQDWQCLLVGDRAPIPRIHFISSILVLPIKTLNLLSRARTPTLLNFAAFCVGFCRDWPFVPPLQKLANLVMPMEESQL
jgi:hypothetical protein